MAQFSFVTRGREIEHLSWSEVEKLFQANPIVMIPVGAQCKEHGLHLPLNNDWLTVKYLTQRVLEELPVVALPPVAYGYFPAFLEYPGSVSLRAETFRETILDICRSISGQGPKKFYALNNGVSTSGPLEEAKKILGAEGISLEYTNLLQALAAVEKEVAEQERGTHADEIETSMMLYIQPQVVKMNLAQKDARPEIADGPLTRNPQAKTGVSSPTGAWGDPTLATAEKGKRVTEALVAQILDFLRSY